MSEDFQMSKFPRVLVTGMPRAGSTRLYNVIREALLVRCPDARSQHFGSFDQLDEALEDPAPGVFKEHTFSDVTRDRIRSGDVLAVATIRDPVPAMVSLCAAFGWDAETAALEVDRSLTCLESIVDQAKIYRYTTATSSSVANVQLVLREAGLPSGVSRK